MNYLSYCKLNIKYDFEKNITGVIFMNNKKSIHNPKDPIEKHDTAAWADIEDLKPISRVTVPSKEQVENAKDWVDTNQK